jgi:uncharacterized membrane protein
MIRATKVLAGLGALLLSLAATQAQAGLTLCNRTSYRLEAAIGLEKRTNVATRGWFCVDPGECKMVLDGTLDADIVYVHARTPPLYGGDPHRLYSYAEAVDGNGRTIKRGDAPLVWGGNVPLCTRDGKFDLSNHRDCAARGLNSAGFAVIDVGANPSATVRFKSRAVSAPSRPGCSISTTRSTRITSISGSRLMSAFAISSPNS